MNKHYDVTMKRVRINCNALTSLYYITSCVLTHWCFIDAQQILGHPTKIFPIMTPPAVNMLYVKMYKADEAVLRLADIVVRWLFVCDM